MKEKKQGTDSPRFLILCIQSYLWRRILPRQRGCILSLLCQIVNNDTMCKTGENQTPYALKSAEPFICLFSGFLGFCCCCCCFFNGEFIKFDFSLQSFPVSTDENIFMKKAFHGNTPNLQSSVFKAPTTLSAGVSHPYLPGKQGQSGKHPWHHEQLQNLGTALPAE